MLKGEGYSSSQVRCSLQFSSQTSFFLICLHLSLSSDQSPCQCRWDALHVIIQSWPYFVVGMVLADDEQYLVFLLREFNFVSPDQRIFVLMLSVSSKGYSFCLTSFYHKRIIDKLTDQWPFYLVTQTGRMANSRKSPGGSTFLPVHIYQGHSPRHFEIVFTFALIYFSQMLLWRSEERSLDFML